MHTDYIIVRVKSDNRRDFRRVREVLHQLAEGEEIDLADVPVIADHHEHFHGDVAKLFLRGYRLTSKPPENLPKTPQA